MASCTGRRIPGEPRVQIDKDRSWQVAYPVGVVPGSSVQIPAHVSENHILPTFFDPSPVDECGDHGCEGNGRPTGEIDDSLRPDSVGTFDGTFKSPVRYEPHEPDGDVKSDRYPTVYERQRDRCCVDDRRDLPLQVAVLLPPANVIRDPEWR